MKKAEKLIYNPNVIWMYPQNTIDENEPNGFIKAIVPFNSNARIEGGNLLRFSGENKFALKIGGTVYEVSTRFSNKGRQSVLEQFKELILSEKLI